VIIEENEGDHLKVFKDFQRANQDLKDYLGIERRFHNFVGVIVNVKVHILSDSFVNSKSFD
jgi:hypothetical protein